MRKWMEAARHAFKALYDVLRQREHGRQEKPAMHHEEESMAQPPTFTREQYEDCPSEVMRAVAESGRVVITDASGEPELTIARQTDELSVG